MDLELFKKKLDRERRARKEAETLLEQKSSQLYQANLNLQQSNEKLESQANELVLARDAALQSSRIKGQFLANMSHEIRTPMNGILGMIELMLDTELNPDQRDYADTVRRSAEHLLNVINDILDFSKIEAGKLTLEEVDFELHREIENTVSMLTEKAASKGLELPWMVQPGVPPCFLGDPGRLRQILLNLLGNALKFTDVGQVSLKIKNAGQIDGKTILRFEVSDTGIGISEEMQKSLFQPFVQADGSTTRKYGGTGLGLAIVRQLVTLMEGTIGCCSTPGNGSTFWFEIKLKHSLTPEHSVLSAKRHWGENSVPVENGSVRNRGILSDIRILVAEDNVINQKVVSRFLSRLGYEFDVVSNGLEVLKALQCKTYHLVLMDCQMPEMDGFASTAAIRAMPHPLAGIPVVALTANAMKEDRQLCLHAGMNDYLSKPFVFQQLAEVIQKCLA